MANAITSVSVAREPRLLGQTVVVIGGSAGIGFETARLARIEGADLVLTARDPKRLEAVAREVAARTSVAFDADDAVGVKRFFDELPAPIEQREEVQSRLRHNPPPRSRCCRPSPPSTANAEGGYAGSREAPASSERPLSRRSRT